MPVYPAIDPHCIRSRSIPCVLGACVATCAATALSHPAVRQRSLAGPVALLSCGADRRASLSSSSVSPGADDPSRAGGRLRPDHGAYPERRQSGAPANQQTCQSGPSAASHHKVASGRSETACVPRRRSSASTTTNKSSPSAPSFSKPVATASSPHYRTGSARGP